jgi:hypothetical protein
MNRLRFNHADEMTIAAEALDINCKLNAAPK